MSKHSTISDRISDVTKFSSAPGSGYGLLKCKTLLWLALPLTLAVGCASGPSRSAAVYNSAYVPAPTITPVSAQSTSNALVSREIYAMWMADTQINYSTLWASVDDGVVTLRGTLPNGAERQRLNDRISELAGVTQVKNEVGDGPPTQLQTTRD